MELRRCRQVVEFLLERYHNNIVKGKRNTLSYQSAESLSRFTSAKNSHFHVLTMGFAPCIMAGREMEDLHRPYVSETFETLLCFLKRKDPQRDNLRLFSTSSLEG